VLPLRPAQRQAQGRQRNQAGEHLAELGSVRHQRCRDAVHGGNAAYQPPENGFIDERIQKRRVFAGEHS
jgi:hypothetical protein